MRLLKNFLCVSVPSFVSGNFFIFSTLGSFSPFQCDCFYLQPVSAITKASWTQHLVPNQEQNTHFQTISFKNLNTSIKILWAWVRINPWAHSCWNYPSCSIMLISTLVLLGAQFHDCADWKKAKSTLSLSPSATSVHLQKLGRSASHQ